MSNDFNWNKVLGDKPAEAPRPEHLGPAPLSMEELSEIEEATPAPAPSKKSIFDSIPAREPGSSQHDPAAPKRAKDLDEGPAMDPRTGEIMTEPVPKMKSTPDVADELAHNKYKPAHI